MDSWLNVPLAFFFLSGLAVSIYDFSRNLIKLKINFKQIKSKSNHVNTIIGIPLFYL